MYPYILCYCGRSLGDIYDIFKIMRINKLIELYSEGHLNIDPALIAISESIKIDLDDVFSSFSSNINDFLDIILCINNSLITHKMLISIDDCSVGKSYTKTELIHSNVC